MRSTEGPPISKWRVLGAVSITIMWYILIGSVGVQVQDFVTEHVKYANGEEARVPVFAFLALAVSVVLTPLLCKRGAWYADLSPTLATLAMAYGVFGPHCEVDLLIFAAWLLASWGFCRPEPKRVALLLFALVIIAEIAPSPFGTPILTIR